MPILEVDQNLVYGAAMERINHYAKHIRQKFGKRVQKITVLGGFTCPNRDGSKSTGGCTYCNNESFAAPQKIKHLTITEQINHGIKVSKRRYKVDSYIVYFQAYSNTYAPLKKLKALYSEALAHPEVIGLSIGTRADCIDIEKLEYLESLAKENYITLELGIESTHDQTLEKINRAHCFKELQEAVKLTKNRNIEICGHLILGFPWESQEDIKHSAEEISKLSIDSLKIHQLHIVKGTAMEKEFNDGTLMSPTKKEYLKSLQLFLEHLAPNIKIQRIFGESPENMMVSSSWHTSTSQFNQEFETRLIENDSYQGKYHKRTSNDLSSL